ncbi:MAG: hypothetical protein IPK71_37110 [Myxococcales bacterium]|nr:hypothetical protein [Myxococcales bacterium]
MGILHCAQRRTLRAHRRRARQGLWRHRAPTTRLKLAEASRLILEDSGTRAVDDAYEESTRRIARGVLPPDSYANVRRHGEAHGESIIQGRARAQKVRARKAKAPKADPATAVKVTSDVTPPTT